jgi:hypothetical protein
MKPCMTRTLLLGAVALLLTACVYKQPTIPLGNAVKQNQAVQIINPAPKWRPGAPDLSGDRAALLMRRYAGQAVVQPEQVMTTQTTQ